MHENSELFSVDCEMCITSAGSELTKVGIFGMAQCFFSQRFLRTCGVYHLFMNRTLDASFFRTCRKIENMSSVSLFIRPKTIVLFLHL